MVIPTWKYCDRCTKKNYKEHREENVNYRTKLSKMDYRRWNLAIAKSEQLKMEIWKKQSEGCDTLTVYDVVDGTYLVVGYKVR